MNKFALMTAIAAMVLTGLATIAAAQDASTQPVPSPVPTEVAPAPTATPQTRPTSSAGMTKEELSYYADMIAQCKLTDEQMTKLQDTVAARREATADYWKENQPKVADLVTKKLAAQKANESKKADDLQNEINAIYDKTRQMHREYEIQIVAILTPQQRQAWEFAKLRKYISQRYSRIAFTEEQEAKVKEFCDDTAKELSQLADPTDRSRDGITDKAVQKINELLTPEQKKMLPRSLLSVGSAPATKPGDN